MASLARMLTRQEKNKEAEILWREVLPKSESVFGSNQKHTLVPNMFPAAILEDNGQVEEAIMLCREAGGHGSQNGEIASKWLGIDAERDPQEADVEQPHPP